jgi:hypothetical protein
MRKPFTSEQIKNSPQSGVFDDNDIHSDVMEKFSAVIMNLPDYESTTENEYVKRNEAAEDLIKSYANFLMQNDPETAKPDQGTFEDAVNAAEAKMKEVLGDKLGAQFTRDIQTSLDKKYEEALGIQSLKRA